MQHYRLGDAKYYVLQKLSPSVEHSALRHFVIYSEHMIMAHPIYIEICSISSKSDVRHCTSMMSL